jgi:hypothetical protein
MRSSEAIVSASGEIVPGYDADPGRTGQSQPMGRRHAYASFGVRRHGCWRAFCVRVLCVPSNGMSGARLDPEGSAHCGTAPCSAARDPSRRSGSVGPEPTSCDLVSPAVGGHALRSVSPCGYIARFGSWETHGEATMRSMSTTTGTQLLETADGGLSLAVRRRIVGVDFGRREQWGS